MISAINYIKSTLTRGSLRVLLLCTITHISCKESGGLPELSPQLNDSIYVWEQSKLKYAKEYNTYLTVTSKDTSIHIEKTIQNTYYPWKANLDKKQADSFLTYLKKNLKADKNYKSAFGELPTINADYTALEKNYIMASLLSCKLAGYSLTNSKGQKINIDENQVGINVNIGSLGFSLAKWDLHGQNIKGEVTLEITLPYNLYRAEIKPTDKFRTLDLGRTKISILEKENNILHYLVDDDKNYSTDVLIDSCMSSSHRFSLPEYFYYKLRKKPNLTYTQFIADSVYFELGRRKKEDPKRVRIVYFESCDPGIINIYGYQRTELLKKLITIPLDTKIR